MVTVGRLDVTIPEMGTVPKAAGQVEHDLGVGAGLATWLGHPLPQLHQRLRLRADLEADLEGLALEGAGNRQHYIGEFGSRVHK